MDCRRVHFAPGNTGNVFHIRLIYTHGFWRMTFSLIGLCVRDYKCTYVVKGGSIDIVLTTLLRACSSVMDKPYLYKQLSERIFYFTKCFWNPKLNHTYTLLQLQDKQRRRLHGALRGQLPSAYFHEGAGEGIPALRQI